MIVHIASQDDDSLELDSWSDHSGWKAVHNSHEYFWLIVVSNKYNCICVGLIYVYQTIPK